MHNIIIRNEWHQCDHDTFALQQEVRVMVTERVVAFGFLTDHDLKLLGSGFSRHFPIDDENLFADLIEQLDRIEIERLDKGIIIRPPVR
jgi:hypothetical protein